MSAAADGGLILGTGADLCDIRRIEQVMARFGDRFLQRVFTDAERARAGRRHPRIQPGTYAKRFAAKEACSKALGTGFSRGVFHSDMGVVNLPSGQPTLATHGWGSGPFAGDYAAGPGGADPPHPDRRAPLCLRAGYHHR